MENAFTRVGTFQYSSEANIIKGKLEAEGIEVFMADGITIDVDPLVSNAIGGVKLFVKTEDAEKAKLVLTEIGRYSIDNEGKPVVCPKCSGTQVEVMSSVKEAGPLMSFIISLLIGLFPFFVKYKYRCNNCGNEFSIK
jgi:hypothetical protein